MDGLLLAANFFNITIRSSNRSKEVTDYRHERSNMYPACAEVGRGQITQAVIQMAPHSFLILPSLDEELTMRLLRAIQDGRHGSSGCVGDARERGGSRGVHRASWNWARGWGRAMLEDVLGVPVEHPPVGQILLLLGLGVKTENLGVSPGKEW